jgi:Nidogen-like/Carboxypeptidase regulatory-like domain
MPRLALLALVGMVMVMTTASTAVAAPGVVQDLPGCTTTLVANDDGSTGLIPLGFEAQMFDTAFDSVFVNNNGNVTMTAALSQFTPFDFRETGQAMIAPFFADVDTRGAGNGIVRYGQVTGGYGGQPAFCVTWDNVGYYNSHTDKKNRFQLVIVQQATGIDVVFNYDSIQWETGDASHGAGGFGGTSAVAGYAAGDGDGAHALMLPGSFVNGGLLDANAGTSLAGHSTAGQPAGRYVFLLRQGAVTGARLTGTITDPGDDPVAGALVQICRDGGTCVTRTTSTAGVYTATNLPAGTYAVTAFPGSDQSFGTARAAGVVVGDPGTTTTTNLQLAALPPAPPEGTTITNIGETDDGLPVAYWTDPLVLATEGCPGAAATYQMVLEGHVVRSGALTETPPAGGEYQATIAALFPNHGDGVLTIHFDCPGADPDEDIEFGIYIDPSGLVRDENGHPVVDATVTLQRSAAAAGPFFTVPNGSAVMSPANRRNPDTTDATGHFGWDVVAGYYVVTATKSGCVSLANPSQAAATSGVLTIPPPVTNLDLRLDCTPPTTGGHTGTGGGGGTTGGSPPPLVPRKLAKLGKVKLSKGKTLTVPLACSTDAKVACAGKVTVKLGGKLVGSKTYKKIKPGKTVKVKVTLSKKGRARIAKVKKGKKFKLVLTATVKDAAGKGATAKKTITLKR